jgi:transcriptional regulator with XRE-family HTH domain
VSTPHVGPFGRIVAANAVRLRRARNLSQTAVVTAMAAVGHPIPRSALSDVECGVRRVDVDDLYALAAALGVTVVQLLAAPACARCHDTPGSWSACLACGAEGAR